MLVKKDINTTNYQNQPSPNEKTTPPFCSFIFLLTIGFIYFTMMPQMTSEEEGPWLNSLPLEHLKCKTSQSNPIMWALKTDQVATTSK
jgi:hypothetical protein